MIIAGVADLHLMPTNEHALQALADTLPDSGAEVLVIAGDLAAGPLSELTAALDLFSNFQGLKLFVPGNHDLWQMGTTRDTWHRYEVELPAITEITGFHCLDVEPVRHGDIGFIGCTGWYDYSLRQTQSPDGNVRVSPGKLQTPRSPLQVLPRRQELQWEQLGPDDYRAKALQVRDANVLQGLVWNDGFYVDWHRSDEQMVDYFCEKLQRQAEQVSARVDRLVAVTHFVPCTELLPRAKALIGAYARAFAGSAKLGETLLSIPKVELAIFGHWHLQGTRTVKHIRMADVSIDHGRLPAMLLEL